MNYLPVGIFITFLFLFILYSYEILNPFYIGRVISLFLGVFILYILLYNITYNLDWNSYVALFKGELKSHDFLFGFISQIYRNNGFGYLYVYKLHILIMGIGFIYFISRFSSTIVFSVISIYCILQLMPLSNQIRYYVAFSFFLVSAYSFVVTRKSASFVLFAVLSILSHSGIILMYPFIYFYYRIDISKYLRQLIIYSLVLGFIMLLWFQFGSVFNNVYGSYFKNRNISSLSGGVYNCSIWLLYYILIYFIYKRQKKHSPHVCNDVKYMFLYKLSIYSIIFVPIGMFIQIVIHRYVIASLIVWFTFFFYSLKYEKSLKVRLKDLTIYAFMSLLSCFYIYILPVYLFGFYMMNPLFKLLMSNSYLISFFR